VLVCIFNFFNGTTMNPAPPSLNDGKVLSRYLKRSSSTTIVLNYPKNEAQRIRALVESIRLRGDRKPALALIARRSISVYLDYFQSSPTALAGEVDALEILATPIATRKKAKQP
jgi:hypothetical protein